MSQCRVPKARRRIVFSVLAPVFSIWSKAYMGNEFIGSIDIALHATHHGDRMIAGRFASLVSSPGTWLKSSEIAAIDGTPGEIFFATSMLARLVVDWKNL